MVLFVLITKTLKLVFLVQVMCQDPVCYFSLFFDSFVHVYNIFGLLLLPSQFSSSFLPCPSPIPYQSLSQTHVLLFCLCTSGLD